MILACSVRGVFALSADGSMAADGRDGTGQIVGASAFSGTDHIHPTKEEEAIALYDRMRPSLLTYLAGVGLSISEAEDVIHESFIRLFDRLNQKYDRQKLPGWIFRVAHNLAMDLFRDEQRSSALDDGMSLLETVLDSSFSPEEHLIKSEEIRRVQRALGRLTQQQRAAVLLRAKELRYREIASILGVSTKRACELIQRALVRLAGDI